MKGNGNMELHKPRKRMRQNFNWKQNTKRWSLITPVQVLFVWILARAKIRYILGVYTIMLTMSLHYGARSVKSLISELHQTISSQEELQARTPRIVHWSMPDATKYALERELVQLRWKDKDSVIHTKIFIEKAKDILQPYVRNDKNLQQILSDLVAGDGSGSTSIDAIVFENLPMDPYVPPTPTDESVRSLHKPTYVGEALLLAMGELAGTYTIGYKAETEYSNPWVHEGFPRPGPGGSALTSTVGTLSHHQDMSYQGVIPNLLGLVCIREGDDPNVQTTLISIETVIQLLPEYIVSILRQDRFKVTASTQWVDVSTMDEGAIKTRSLLDGRSLHVPVHWENMEGIDTEASDAVDRLRHVLLETKPTGVHLRKGSMLLFNNQKVVHGRTSYRNLKYDGSDRVVLRSYFVKDLNEDELKSRML